MKKIYILLVSIICFFALIFISVPYLVGNKKNTKVNEKNIDLINSINRLNESRQKLQYSLLNKDNLYENYSYNYAIKIPEGYKTNKGIDKYSSVQFYNEQLGYVVVVNVVESDFKDISLQDNNMIINKFEREYKTDLLLNDIIEKALIDRGYNSPKFLSSEKVNYNNRDFLNLNHKAFRRSNKNNSPVMMSSFITYYKEYVYFILFVSYQFSSTKNWEIEIEKSMSNLFINKFITKKD